MPTYDYRCNSCGKPFSLFYKSYAAYDAAAGTRVCPHCGSQQIVGVIASVSVQAAGEQRDFGKMSSGEMLSVLESGKADDVKKLYQQTGADKALTDPGMRKATDTVTKKSNAS